MPETKESIDRHYASHLDTMTNRVEQALERAGFDRLLIFAGEAQPIQRDDQTYPFRADPYFVQCVPLADAEGSVIELVPGERPRLIFYRPDDFWNLPADIPDAAWAKHFDIEVVASAAERRAAIARAGVRTAGIGLSRMDDSACDAIDDAVLLRNLDFARATKTEYEIHCMKAATRSAVTGHNSVASLFVASSVGELALAQRFCEASEQRESDLPYPSIVAVNEHAATLHYQKLDREPPRQTRSLLIDAGTSHLGYSSDITRTHCRDRNGFAELIEALDQLQQSLCAEVRVGADFVELNELAHRLLAGLLEEHELIKCGQDEAYECGLTTKFLPHGLGHLLGLQVHDVGGHMLDVEGTVREPPAAHRFLRLTRRLEVGFVVTIEPGIYFIPMLLDNVAHEHKVKINWTSVDRLMPYGGIRIEDNVLVESEGSANLTRLGFAALAE